MNKSKLLEVLTLLVLLGGFYLLYSKQLAVVLPASESPKLGSDYFSPLASRIGRYATSGPAFLSSNVVTVLATTSNRIFAEICNPSNVGGGYLGFGFTPAATQNSPTGLYLAPRTCYQLAPGKNLFVGAVYGTASTTESSTLQLTTYEASF